MALAAPAFLSLAARVASLLLAGALQPLTAAAQAPSSATPPMSAEALQQLQQIQQQLGGQGAPLGDAVARVNRMTDPNAGKRPGDDKLSCAQIKVEFDDTNQKYTAQSARQEAAKEAVEADARKAAAEAGSSPAAVASGFFGGLAAIAAHAVGAGDAYNEKLKAEAIATQSRREALQNQFAQESEASKALSDRGRGLMTLGQSKGCSGLVYKP